MKLWTALILPVAALAQVVIPARSDRELRDVPRLTDAQYGTIFQNTSQHRFAQTSTLTRVNTLNREIETETRREQPDTGALGASYQEIESQCRRYAESLRDLNQVQLRVLNEEQRTALRNLTEHGRRSRLAPLAEAVFLIPRREGIVASRWFDLTLVSDVPPDLAVYLGLSSAQLEAIRGALRGYRDFVASRRARVAEVNQEIEAEMARPAPSSSELGTRYWEIEAHRRQIEEREASLLRTTPELLNAEQRARLSSLVQPVERLEAISQTEGHALIFAASSPASQAGSPGFNVSPIGRVPVSGLEQFTPQASPGRSCIGARSAFFFEPVPL